MKINKKGFPVPETIPELLILTFANKDNRKILLFLAEIEKPTIEIIKKTINLDLTGYKIMLDNYSITHVFTRHSNPIKELARGNEPILFEDFNKITSILNQPDLIKSLDKTKQGIAAIVFEKVIANERFYCIQEVRTKKKRLCLKTMYKKKSSE